MTISKCKQHTKKKQKKYPNKEKTFENLLEEVSQNLQEQMETKEIPSLKGGNIEEKNILDIYWRNPIKLWYDL